MIISAKEREAGSKTAKKIRREGKIPAVLYGLGIENVNLEMDRSEFLSALRKSNRNDKFDLNIEGKGSFNVFVKSLQREPVTEDIQHVDFYKLTDDRMIQVDVPVKLVGESKGVKLGGKLYQPRRKISVFAFPKDIPNEITIDISDMQIGDVFHVFDLDLPEGVTVKSSKNFTIAAVLGASKEEQEEIAEEEEEAEEGTEE